MLGIIWIIIILATIFIADNKKRNITGWFFLSLFFGPVALLAVLLSGKIERTQVKLPPQSTELSLSSIRVELENLKTEFNALNNRLNNLLAKADVLEAEEINPPLQVLKKEEQQPAGPLKEKTDQALSRKTDIEMDLGKYWLNKIGITVFSIGLAFLLTYTLAHFGPAAKIIFGYLIAVVLFIIGLKLEKKERFINYAKVLLSGGWAITYFTTYAMYHFEAAKIINNQFLDLFLLAIVAFGIIAYSLRYNSQSFTAITLFIGYFTSTLGDVGYFTLINAALLAVAALIIVSRMQWVRFIFMGIILTYLTHIVWVIKQILLSRVAAGVLNVENVYFVFDAGFLSVYWLLFATAIHLIKNNTRPSYKNLAAANFLNFILFFFMVYPKFYFFYPVYKFNAVMGLGAVYTILAIAMEKINRKELFISDIIIAVSLLTLAVPLKFLPYHTTVIWFIELPFLLLTGFIFERRVFRYLGFALSLVLFFKFVVSDWQLPEQLRIFSITTSWSGFLSFAGFISASVCYYLYRRFEFKKDNIHHGKQLQNIYSGFSAVYLTICMWESIKLPWMTLGFSVESLLIFILGVLISDRCIRYYALVILALAGIRFCFFDRYCDAAELKQLFLVYVPVACAFAEYFIYRKFNKKPFALNSEIWLAKFLFFAAILVFIFAVVMYVQQIWITFSLELIAILVLLWGRGILDKDIRLYSLLVLGLAAMRFSFVDAYYGLSKFLQWLFISVKIICAYAVYFIYRGMDKKQLLEKFEKSLISPIFYVSSFFVVLVIFKYIKDIWVAVSLGLVGVVLFITGFLIKDRIFRHGGFIIFAITLLRVLFVDLSGFATIYKIISFIIIGVLFLGVSFIYTKYMTEKGKEKK